MVFEFRKKRNVVNNVGERDGRFFADSQSRLFTIVKGEVFISTENGSSFLSRADIHYFLMDRKPGNSEPSLFIEYSKSGRTMKMEVGEVKHELKNEVAQWARQVNQRYYHNPT